MRVRLKVNLTYRKDYHTRCSTSFAKKKCFFFQKKLFNECVKN